MDIGDSQFVRLIDNFRSKTILLRKLPTKHRGRKRPKNGARTTERLLISSDVLWTMMTTPNLARFQNEPSLAPQSSTGRGA